MWILIDANSLLSLQNYSSWHPHKITRREFNAHFISLTITNLVDMSSCSRAPHEQYLIHIILCEESIKRRIHNWYEHVKRVQGLTTMHYMQNPILFLLVAKRARASLQNKREPSRSFLPPSFPKELSAGGKTSQLHTTSRFRSNRGRQYYYSYNFSATLAKGHHGTIVAIC